MRAIGASLVFVGCLGLGVWYREQLMGRVRGLRLLKSILELLSSEVRYGRSTLPECCRHVAAQLSSPFAEAMRAVDERMQENVGDTFAEVFRECTKEPLESLPLKEEDRENFLQFASEAGFVDGQMQLRVMERSGELLAGTAERLERENVEKCRMAVGLGAMGGLLLILVLW